MHDDHGVQTGGGCSVFPGSICVSGFATPVVNCGTARVPMGLPVTHTYKGPGNIVQLACLPVGLEHQVGIILPLQGCFPASCSVLLWTRMQSTIALAGGETLVPPGRCFSSTVAA